MPTDHTSRNGFYFDFSPLRESRRKVMWSQTELANRVGIHRVTLARIERNRLVPSLPLAFALARTLGVPIFYIFKVVEV